jgi:pyroglutamyl-peptidase
MMRRRHKTPKVAHSAPKSRGPHTRRRARDDAVVPPELKLDAGRREEVKSPPPAARKVKTPPRTDTQKTGDGPPGSHRPSGASLATKTGVRPLALVTGFEPFEGDTVNASWETCRQLAREVAGLRVETLRVPVEFRRAIEVVCEAIERLKPTLVIGLGQAAGRMQLAVERVAINLDDARIADNAGARPIDEPVARNGPAAYFATVPVKAMAHAMRKAGAPTYVSNTAGTFVCNHLMYGVLHYLAASGRKGTRAGFIHVPCVESQAMDKPALPTMSVVTMARGIEAAIGAAHTVSEDIDAAEGALD